MSRNSRPHRLHNNRRWRRIARHQLKIEPLCRFCRDEGRVEPAVIVDHVVPHNGDITLFWTGELQSLCRDHHEGKKQRLERRGYDTSVGLDGWPLDPRHPANNPANKPVPMRRG